MLSSDGSMVPSIMTNSVFHHSHVMTFNAAAELADPGVESVAGPRPKLASSLITETGQLNQRVACPCSAVTHFSTCRIAVVLCVQKEHGRPPTTPRSPRRSRY